MKNSIQTSSGKGTRKNKSEDSVTGFAKVVEIRERKVLRCHLIRYLFERVLHPAISFAVLRLYHFLVSLAPMFPLSRSRVSQTYSTRSRCSFRRSLESRLLFVNTNYHENRTVFGPFGTCRFNDAHAAIKRSFSQ